MRFLPVLGLKHSTHIKVTSGGNFVPLGALSTSIVIEVQVTWQIPYLYSTSNQPLYCLYQHK